MSPRIVSLQWEGELAGGASGRYCLDVRQCLRAAVSVGLRAGVRVSVADGEQCGRGGVGRTEELCRRRIM